MTTVSGAKTNIGKFIRRYVDYVRLVFTDPSGFFLRKSEESGYLEPTVFALMSILLPKLFYALLLAPLTLGLSLVLVLPSVIYNLGMILIASILLFGLVRVFGGRGDFETAYRGVAYAGAANLVLVVPVPVINFLLFTGLFGLLLYFALREMHGLDNRRALIALSVPVLFTLFVGMIRTLMFIFFLIKGLLYVFSMGYPL